MFRKLSIRFVYFDLDDTLLDHRAAERAALSDLCRSYPSLVKEATLPRVQEVYHEGNVSFWRAYAAGRITRDALRRGRFAYLLDRLGVTGFDPMQLSQAYESFYARHWCLIEGADTAFLAISEAYPVGILTNGFAHLQYLKLDRFPALRDRAKAFVVSEEVGHMKPHPAIFEHAAQLAGCPADSILYVGDSLTSDVAGGRQAGWHVAWYDRHDTGRETDANGAHRFSEWTTLVSWLI